MPPRPVANRCSRAVSPASRTSPHVPAGTAAGAGLAPDAPKPEEASYTNRLLKAKQRVWEDREKEKEKDKDKS